VAQRLMPAQVRALGTLKGEPAAEPDKSVQAHARLWLQKLQTKVAAGRMTATRADNNRSCLRHFLAFVGAASDVASVNAQAVEGLSQYALRQVAERRQDRAGKQGWSLAYAKDVFAVARAFVRWLWESGTIDLPRNLDSRGFDFGGHGQVVQTWTVEEFQRAVAAAPASSGWPSSSWRTAA